MKVDGEISRGSERPSPPRTTYKSCIKLWENQTNATCLDAGLKKKKKQQYYRESEREREREGEREGGRERKRGRERGREREKERERELEREREREGGRGGGCRQVLKTSVSVLNEQVVLVIYL